MKLINKTILGALLGATAIAAVPTVAQADGCYNNGRIVVYFTRHAEKQPLLTAAGDADPDGNPHFVQPKGAKGAEELNEFGEQRAAALADWFLTRGFTSELTHIFSSQKLRTRQTIAAIAVDALSISGDALITSNNDDYIPEDAIQQFPTNVEPGNYEGRLETIDSPSSSVDPTVTALCSLSHGSVALVAMHSGTFYKILSGLGIDSGEEVTDEGLFPKGEDGKISTFGDLWKIVIRNGDASVKWRKNLQFAKYKVEATYTH